MEDVDIYGKYTLNVPGLNTIKTLEKRKKYILKKIKDKIDENSYYGYLIEEIKALEKTMNFIQWIQNNLSNAAVKEVIGQYKAENIKNIEEVADEEMVDEEGAEIISILHEKFNKNHKVEIILSINKGIKFVTMQGTRRKKDKVLWVKTNKCRMTINKLERILRRLNGIENV